MSDQLQMYNTQHVKSVTKAQHRTCQNSTPWAQPDGIGGQLFLFRLGSTATVVQQYQLTVHETKISTTLNIQPFNLDSTQLLVTCLSSRQQRIGPLTYFRWLVHLLVINYQECVRCQAGLLKEFSWTTWWSLSKNPDIAMSLTKTNKTSTNRALLQSVDIWLRALEK